MMVIWITAAVVAVYLAGICPSIRACRLTGDRAPFWPCGALWPLIAAAALMFTGAEMYLYGRARRQARRESRG